MTLSYRMRLIRAALLWAALIALVLCSGCASRRDQGRTAADVWHVGHAMDLHAEVLPPSTIRIMGQTLKACATRWAEELRVQIDTGSQEAAQ